uniref:Uncharacterized protein n=1 Tax=Fagus sylvatica TaxID=28930 RepID=A0A2N9EUH9_FAGSY
MKAEEKLDWPWRCRAVWTEAEERSDCSWRFRADLIKAETDRGHGGQIGLRKGQIRAEEELDCLFFWRCRADLIKTETDRGHGGQIGLRKGQIGSEESRSFQAETEQIEVENEQIGLVEEQIGLVGEQFRPRRSLTVYHGGLRWLEGAELDLTETEHVRTKAQGAEKSNEEAEVAFNCPMDVPST